MSLSPVRVILPEVGVQIRKKIFTAGGTENTKGEPLMDAESAVKITRFF
jgi:hypothetical protein